MKFTNIRTDKNGQQHLKCYEPTTFFERIQRDANRDLIGTLRKEVVYDNPQNFSRYHEIPHIYVAAELRRQANGAIGLSAFNDLVVLEVRQLMSPEDCEAVKHAAKSLPMTYAAFVGATGQEVVILVALERGDSALDTEAEMEAFYVQAYSQAAQLYDAVLPHRVTRMQPSLRHSFLLPLDEAPYVNPQAKGFNANLSASIQPKEDSDDHLLLLPEKRLPQEKDMTAYQNYERSYEAASRRVASQINETVHNQDYTRWLKEYATCMAAELFRTNWPQEETVYHLYNHMRGGDKSTTEEFVRSIVDATYTELQALHPGRKNHGEEPAEPLMQQVVRRMESCYCFRRNTVMGYEEYRPNHTWPTPWKPVTEEVINTFTMDLQIAGVDVWNRDVKRYVHSTRVPRYDPIEEYLYKKLGKWDGRDHIRMLAATVPTKNPQQWADWFHSWFLAMVAQWTGRDRRYGNAIVPLLISNQGMHKSAFCRLLLPPELRSWGYSDNLSLAEERSVHLAMSQMLLINLDEFNRISPAKQQGFLKNIVQLPSVKVKRPYASHTEDVPRLTSFIATTNISDVLTDPSGSRRFIGVEVTGNIDLSQTPHYEQLYAQAVAELNAGVRYWFDDKETEDIMRHNQQFQKQDTAEQFFHDLYEIASPGDPEARWLSATEILSEIKKHAKGLLKNPSAISLGRTLKAIDGIGWKRAHQNNVFCVKPRL